MTEFRRGSKVLVKLGWSEKVERIVTDIPEASPGTIGVAKDADSKVSYVLRSQVLDTIVY